MHLGSLKFNHSILSRVSVLLTIEVLCNTYSYSFCENSSSGETSFVCYKQLKETLEQHSTELKELIRMVTTLNLKFDQSAKKSKAIVAPIKVGGLIPTKPRTGFASGTVFAHTR